MRSPRERTQSVVTLRQRRVSEFRVRVAMFDVEAFIEAVKERQALYNVNHINYSRKDVRTCLWDEIGQIMFPEWKKLDYRDKTERVTYMQKKWKSLKDCFNREVRVQKTEDPKKHRKRYEFYDKLTFLLRRHTREEEEEQQSLKSRNPETSQPLTLTLDQLISASEGNERKRKQEGELPREQKTKSHKRSEDAEDGDRLFLLSFLGDLRGLPLATRYWVKMKFSEIMHQAAMSLESFQEADHMSTSMDCDQEIGSPVSKYLSDYSEKKSPQDAASEIYDLCND